MKTRLYKVRNEQHAWARIWITEDGSLAVLSDFGSYGYHWSNTAHADFRQFLLECDTTYLMGKLAGGRREFDGERTAQIIREQLEQAVQTREISQAKAECERKLLDRWAPFGNGSAGSHEFRNWAEETTLDWELSELSSSGPPLDVRMFLEGLWPKFREALEEELEAEKAAAEQWITRGEWIAVDLDRTLAEYHGEQESLSIGKPVAKMVERVKRWIAAGKEVRIFTARVDGGQKALAMGNALGEQYRDVAAIRAAIEQWCLEHIGIVLPITNVKDYGTEEIWDDRAVQVEPNTGRRMDGLED